VPIFSRFWLTASSPPAADPEQLRVRGAALQVEITVPSMLANVLQRTQKTPLPAPQVGMALIDTGASITAVEETILQGLGLTATSAIQVAVPGGRASRPLYACDITLPGTPIPTLLFNSVVGTELATLGFSALIGRDVLRHFQLVYNGAEGFWTLAF
jgi:hypothetical protein